MKTANNRISKLEEAREMLAGWKKAECAVMSGQEYYMGSSRLRRADLSQIAARIKYWENEVLKLERGSDHRIRVQRVVVRDV